MKDSKKTTPSPTKLKSMRLSTKAIDIVQKMAQNENRNFTNMVETIIFRADQTAGKQKTVQ